MSRAGRVIGRRHTAWPPISRSSVVVAAGTATAATRRHGGCRSADQGAARLPRRHQADAQDPQRPCHGAGHACTPTGRRRLLAGADFGGSDPGDDAAATARDVFAGLQKMLQRGRGPRLRPLSDRPPTRCRKMVSRSSGAWHPRGGLYLAVTHSGVTLAPAIGLFAAAEIFGATARSPAHPLFAGPVHGRPTGCVKEHGEDAFASHCRTSSRSAQ